ncbi:uncharacterized protein LOC108105339 [Drosophila eugracilis]|uniref:uncharacterized protein LOC108105339 n=1 Tax=Drosophila eugracilis TaxID=29029 RepID=UPI0007E621E1|nr:uncharacterized protein LOC108105339 [Drosophila eugracilis]
MALESFGKAVTVCKDQRLHPGRLTCPMASNAANSRRGSCLDDGLADMGICRDDYKSLFLRGRCHRTMARPDLALLDIQRAQQALEMMLSHRKKSNSNVPRSAAIVAEKCDDLFDANEFEKTLTTAYMEGRPFGHSRFQLIKHRTLSVLEDTLGESLRPFMQQHIGVFEEVSRREKELDVSETRPLWKTLRDRQHCDVQSVLDKETVQWTPLQKARQQASERLYSYNYMGRSAIDVALLRQLRSDSNFLDPLRIATTPTMRQMGEEQYSIVRRFMKMMQARNPLYNRRHVRQRHGRIDEQELRRRREVHLFHTQHQIRRDCLRMLHEVHRRRREGNVEKLSDYVESIMSGFIELKNHRALPWKWELLNDIYNTVAMAYCDRCAVPANVNFLEAKNRPTLYLLQPEKVRDINISFGGPNIYLEIEREEERHSRINQKLEHLEARLRHSRYPIERSYLFFEIARCHFKESRFDKCLVVTRKSFKEARSCNCLIWMFNSIFLGCQVYAVLNRCEQLKESLAKAYRLATELKAPKLVAYTELCINVNAYDLSMRQVRHSDISLRKPRKRSPNGLSTQASVISLASKY